MKIILICQQSLQNHSIPAYSFWEKYFKRGIEEAGHEWFEVEGVDWAEGLVYLEEKALNQWKEYAWNLTISQIKKLHQAESIDILISYLFPTQVEPSAISEIQSLGIPCVNFFCDNVREFTSIPKSFYCFDLHWVPEYKALNMYKQAGLNFVNAPMPVWIPPNQKTYNHPENYGVSFIGSRDAQREALLAKALSLGAVIDIRGPGWSSSKEINSSLLTKKQNLWNSAIEQKKILSEKGLLFLLWKITYKLRPTVPDNLFEDFIRETVFGTKYVEVTQQSMITLGVNRYPSYRYPFFKPDTYSRLRDIEAPMMGACYLTEWTEGLEQLYDLHEEIEVYRTAEEMVDKIRRLQSQPEKRKRMRYQCQKRALTEHTIAKSITKIQTALGLTK
ncbi:MAG TPA: glycosyltransferase [Leptolyngbyaceae cyanobacterium]